MADREARPGCRESTSNLRPGGDQSPAPCFLFTISCFLCSVFSFQVSSLEPCLEAPFSLWAMLYLASVEPSFFASSWSQINLIRAYGTMCFTMALFIKSGPCFCLQSQGLFSGICTWRFAVVFLVNTEALHCKISWALEPSTKILNLLCVALLSALLSVSLIYKALGSWSCTMKSIATYPALVVLPIVSYFSFGKIQEPVSQPALGLALSWKWTFVNMLMSLSVTTALHMHEMTHINLGFLEMSLTESVGSGRVPRGWSSQADYIGAWSKDVLVSSFLTILLFWRQEPVYGVLLPELTNEPHVMRDGVVEPLGISSPAEYSRQAGF